MCCDIVASIVVYVKTKDTPTANLMLLKADVFTLLQLGSSRTLQKAWKNYGAKKKKFN